MSENLNNLFNATENNEAAANARSLAGTAQLTSLSTTIAGSILQVVNDNFEQYKETVAASKHEHNAMDKLIAEAHDLTTVDVEFLKALDETTLDLMLKSQQSKRSRSKGKVMTMDNYKSMMIGAIAENLIRIASGKSKSAGGSRRLTGTLEYTAEQLEELNNDQEKLRKEIRNVQSKKSIMKSKEGFSETDERWQQLLVAEEQLKGLRSDTKVVTETVEVDTTKNALTEVFAGVDPSALKTMKNADAKALLEKAMALLAGKQPEENQEVAHDEQ